MTELLISLVRSNMMKNYKIQIEASDLCILDSSTDKKFSKHLIFSNTIFTDCSTCGKYVANLLTQLTSDVLEKLSVVNRKGKDVLFIDQSIYTKNRNFRLFLSSKFGQSTALRICHTMTKTQHQLPEETIFFQSLITHVQANANVIPFDECSTDGAQSSNETKRIKTSDSSPYKEFDEFLLSLITPGKIVKIIHYENGGTGCPMVVYNVDGYRYCPNIQRCHMNNKGEPSL